MAIFVLLLSVLLCFALLALFAFGAEDAAEVLKAPAHAFRERTWFGESGKRTARFGALFKRLVSDTRGAILPAVGRFSELVTVDNGITSLGTKRVRFVDLPAELHGRAVHLEGVEIQVGITYNATGSAVPKAVTGDVVLSAIKNVKLRVGEHLYIDDLDGRDLYQCALVRKGAMVSALPATIADSDATGTATTLSLYIPFNRPNAHGRARNDGVIPVAFFKGDENARNALEFTIGQIRDVPGLTVASVTDIKVRAFCTCLDDLKVSAWQWYNRLGIADRYIDHEPPGAIEAMLLNPFTTDDLNDTLDHSAIKLKVAGQTVFDDLDTAELRKAFVAMHADAGNTPDPGLQSRSWVPLLGDGFVYNRTKLPRGRVRAEWTTTDFSGQDRFTFMVWNVVTPELETALARAAGAPKDPTSARGARYLAEGYMGNDKDSPVAEPILDRVLYWRGMPFGIAAAKAESRGAP